MRKFGLLVVFGFLLTLVFAPSAQEENWDHLSQGASNLLRLERYAEGINIGERALELATKNFGSKDPRIAVSLGCLAQLYEGLWRYSEAEPLYKRGLEIVENNEDKDNLEVTEVLADLSRRLAKLYWTLGRYSEAEILYKRSLEACEKAYTQDHERVAAYLNDLAHFYTNLGRYSEAVPLYKRSLEIFEKNTVFGSPSSLIAFPLNNIAQIYKEQGMYSEAESFYKRSEKMLKKAFGEDHLYVGTALINLANLYMRQGRYSETERLLKKSLEIFEKSVGKDHPHLSYPLNALAGFYRSQGKYIEALGMLEASLAVRKGKGLDTDSPLNLIGDIYLDRGEIAKAEPIVQEVGTNEIRGRLCLMKREFEKARDYYEQIRESSEVNRATDGLFLAYTGLGMTYEGMEDDARAQDYYLRAVDLTEDLRSSLKLPERETFFDVRIHGMYRTAPYEGYARVCLGMNSPLEALKGSEYCKARMYAERISARTETKPTDVPSDVLEKDEDFHNRLSALKQARREALRQNNQDCIKALEPQLAQLEGLFTEHLELLREKYPLFAATKYPQPMDLQQAALKPDEWTLAYQITDTGICIWLLKGKVLVKSQFKPIPRQELNELVRTFRKPLDMDAITKENLLAFRDALGTGKRLFDLLVSDFVEFVPERQPLMVMPDGTLGLIPFEMLVMKEGTGWNTSAPLPYPEGAAYFVDRNPISYYQSLTALTLARTLGQTKQAGPRTLVMADPVFQPDDARLQKMARQRRAELLASVPKKLMSIQNETGLVFNRLPLTGELGTALKNLQPDLTDLYTGIDANKPLFLKKKLDKYDTVIFATHGYMGEGLPGIMEPVLVLTLTDQPADQDGFLRMSEVMSLDLCADVVALTACQTGLGREVKGEGTMGMGRAFQYAGAKSVLMSLWSVSESSTTKLAEKFLSYIKQGKNRLEALQLARREIRAQGYEHPFFWAPFILVGEVQ